MPFRIDSAQPFRSPEKTPEGFLKAEAVIATVGVVTYQRPDGSKRRELRLPEEVFRADSVKTAEMIPVTREHPAKLILDLENTKRLQVGQIGTPFVDGNFVRAPILLTDPTAIDEVLSRKRDCTSPGYLCRTDSTSGVHPEYGAYDCIQRDIRFNHLALTVEGRQGPDVRVRLDSQDAEQVDPAPPEIREDSNMRKIKLHGVMVEVPEAMADMLEAAEKTRNDSMAALTAQNAEKTAALEKVTARADSAEAALKTAEKARNDAADPKRFSEAVNTRVQLVARSAKVLGAEVKLDSLDEQGIKLAVLAKLQPELKLDGRAPEYISARFDAELERAEAVNPADQVRVDGEGVPTDPKPGDRGDRGVRLDFNGEFKSFQKSTEQAWKRPLSRSRQTAPAAK